MGPSPSPPHILPPMHQIKFVHNNNRNLVFHITYVRKMCLALCPHTLSKFTHPLYRMKYFIDGYKIQMFMSNKCHDNHNTDNNIVLLIL